MHNPSDLFGFDASSITGEVFSATYCSGVSAYWDCRGAMESGCSVGVVATDTPLRTIELLQSYANSDGRVFIDSGAFNAFKKHGSVNFENVFAAYDAVLEKVKAGKQRNIALVMPDVIGNQTGTMLLLDQHRNRILDYLAQGADVIIPLQRGELPVYQVAQDVLSMFGTQVRLGIPSNAAALSDEELAKIRHNKFHILGKASMDTKLRRRVYTLQEGNPNADLTCDANLLRSRMDKLSDTHRELIAEEQDPFGSVFDDTELIWSILNEKNWLKRSEIGCISSLYGAADQLGTQRFVKAHKEGTLSDLIEAYDPECHFLYSCLPSLFGESARKMLSARLRGRAVAKVLAA